jgi:hypothetical protein
MSPRVSKENDEKIAGSLVLSVLAGAAGFWVSASIATLAGLSWGQIKLIDYPQPVPRPIESWDILTFVISLAVAAVTSIFAFRQCMKSGPR